MPRFVRITNTTQGACVGHHVRVAETPLARIVGLLGQRGLDPGEGLWIRPSSGVHTFGMKFAIDVVGLDGNLRVTRLWEALLPHRVTSVSTRVRSVIELPAGRIASAALVVGDVLCAEDLSAVLPVTPFDLARAASRHTLPALTGSGRAQA